MSRDWQKDLWMASFKGVPFWIERYGEKGGRRLAIHEMPHRNDPFIEDLGRKAKCFTCVIYLVGDTSDTDAGALGSAFDGDGSGTLVLPTHGPVANCYCEDFERNFQKDRLGYIAFDAKFWKDGPTNQSFTSPYLQQLVYDAIDALTVAASSTLSAIDLSGPGYLTETVVEGFETAIATLESIRAIAPIDTSQSLSITTTLSTLYASVAASISQSTGVDPVLVSSIAVIAQTMVDAMPGASATDLFAEAYDDAAVSSGLSAEATPVGAVMAAAASGLTANAQKDQVNTAEVLRQQRLVLIAAYVAGLMASTFASRQDGLAARTGLVARFDLELDACTGAATMDLYQALLSLRDQAISWLSQVINSLQLVVTVSAQRQMPALWWAWRLYQDPTRASEIIARNRVPHPSFCPERLEVLSPSS